MIAYYQLTHGCLVATAQSLGNVLVVLDPDDKEKAMLIKDYGIDGHTLQSALDPDELGRLEFESNYIACIVKRPKKYTVDDNFVFKVSSVGLFLLPDKLIVVLTNEDLNWQSRFLTKLDTLQEVLLKIIYYFIVHFEEHLKAIRKISEELEGEVNQAVTNHDLLNMFKISKGLVYYVEAINSNSKVIERLKRHALDIKLDRQMLDFIDDLMIESQQCYQQATSYLEVLSGMTDALASIINNNLNIRIKRLTIVSICIMTPTFVVSLFSMNVPLPIAQSGTLMSFWIVIGLSTISVIALLIIGAIRKL